MLTFFKKNFHKQKNGVHLQPQRDGIIAQLVEQRTENPCVAGSIPADTTKALRKSEGFSFAGSPGNVQVFTFTTP